MNSLGIYISVPFCRAKCTYCNFASGVSSVSAHEHYVARVCGEIRDVRRRLGSKAVPEQVDTIYLGGGTPSVLSPRLLGQLADTLRQEFTIAGGAEITVECAPGQLDGPALAALLALGVNRVSFGVQSLVDREAAATGRFHTREVVLSDLERVRSAGLHNLSIDLIAGMPYQTEASWRESLQVLVSSGVQHASVYMLEIDDDSRLGREILAGGSRYHAQAVPSEELTADFYEEAVAFLEANGLKRYEISNFAGSQRQSRHNLKYWQRAPYLGFGLDAHSLVRGEDGRGLRLKNCDSLADYLRQEAEPQVHRVSTSEELEEAWFLGLRLSAGVEWKALVDEFGRERVEVFLPLMSELDELGLLTQQDGAVRLTSRGILFSNDVFARFIGSSEGASSKACPELVEGDGRESELFRLCDLCDS